MPRCNTPSLRRGTTLVETAFIITLAAMFLFGIIEFARFIFVRQVADNAAREGARYAVVHATNSGLEDDTKAVVLQRMAGVHNGVRNFVIKVYKANDAGAYAGSPESADFGTNIAVEISCDYDPVLPAFLFLGNTIPIKAKVLMNSEAN